MRRRAFFAAAFSGLAGAAGARPPKPKAGDISTRALGRVEGVYGAAIPRFRGSAFPIEERDGEPDLQVAGFESRDVAGYAGGARGAAPQDTKWRATLRE